MKNVIEQLRKLDGTEGVNWDDAYEEIDSLLSPRKNDNYTVKTVYHDFEEGGRWTNIETDVFRIEQQDGEVAYFEFWREVPATELQEGMDFALGFYEVVPKEVIAIRYLRKGDA